MPRFTVIEGGHPEQPRSETADNYLNALWNSLPAKSIKDIAKKMSAQLGSTVTYSTANNWLHYLRTHHEYNWTVPPVKRGHSNDKNRFFATQRDHTDDPPFTVEEQDLFNAGLEGTVSGIATVANTQTYAIELAIPYMDETNGVRRRAASLYRKLKYLSEEATELLEQIRAQRAA